MKAFLAAAGLTAALGAPAPAQAEQSFFKTPDYSDMSVDAPVESYDYLGVTDPKITDCDIEVPACTGLSRKRTSADVLTQSLTDMPNLPNGLSVQRWQTNELSDFSDGIAAQLSSGEYVVVKLGDVPILDTLTKVPVIGSIFGGLSVAGSETGKSGVAGVNFAIGEDKTPWNVGLGYRYQEKDENQTFEEGNPLRGTGLSQDEKEQSFGFSISRQF